MEAVDKKKPKCIEHAMFPLILYVGENQIDDTKKKGGEIYHV